MSGEGSDALSQVYDNINGEPPAGQHQGFWNTGDEGRVDSKHAKSNHEKKSVINPHHGTFRNIAGLDSPKLSTSRKIKKITHTRHAKEHSRVTGGEKKKIYDWILDLKSKIKKRNKNMPVRDTKRTTEEL